MTEDQKTTEKPTEFEAAGQSEQMSLAAEFIEFVLENKAWWMIPIVVVLGLVGILVALGSTGAAPFIYTLF